MRNRFILRPWMIFVALLILLLAAMAITFAATGRSNTPVENALGATVAPLQDGAAQSTNAVANFFGRLFGTRDVDKEYEQLKAEVARLQTENALYEATAQENERLLLLLGVPEQYPQYEFVHARVTAREPGSWFMTFQINRGSTSGIEIDMAVVNQDGLVGRVCEVGPNWARVLTVIDTQSAVSAIVERTRDHGIIKGAADAEAANPQCTVDYLPVDSDLAPGDRFLTSNLGGIFPQGLPVGTVVEVGRDQNSEEYALIQPTVDFAHLEDVLVIKGVRDLPAKSAEPEAEATPTPEPTAEPTAAPEE